jgi:endonuclease/exonuclease/phosphatase (EEP) superfamily protein YafD
MHGPMRRLATIAVCGYAAAITALWLTVDLLSDRLWPATLVAFGPRWPAALPLLPLALLVVVATPARVGRQLIGIIGLTGLVLVFGFMDLRLGLEREPGTPVLRIMTDNVGGGNVTAQALDRLMRAEQVDVAALQECPFYDYDMARLGWRFYYSGDLCLVSRYPFVVLDEREPEEKWRRGGHEPDRFEIDAPIGRFQLLNVHLGTIRGGLEALRDGSWHALPLFDGNREEASRESRAARRRATPGTEPIVVAGDFNLPVESAIYRASWGDFGNAFSSCGRGFGYTKFTSLFGIRIDHVLMSNRWRCADARVLTRPYGGDHAPLVVDLVIENY